MSKGVFVALSGAVTQEHALENTAANLANASSPAYQRMRPVFREALAAAKGGDKNLHYGKIERTALDTTAGSLRPTGRGLDVALPPERYLAVSTPRGERVTRAGSIKVDTDGTLMASGGVLLSTGDQPIKAKPQGGELRVDPDGTVKQGNDALGKLKLVKFETPSALVHESGGLLATGAAGAMEPATESVEVGSLEESNAAPAVAMTELMTASRTFEAFQKCIEAFGEMDRKLLTTVPGAFE